MRLAILTTFIAPYRLPLFQRLSEYVDNLRIFVSTSMESNRNWVVRWDNLDVKLQKTISIKRVSKNWMGFTDVRFIHIPISTLFDLNNYRPSVIISSEFGARTLGALIYKFIQPKCKIIIWATLSEHTEKKRGLFRRLLRKTYLRFTDATIVNGSSGFRYLQALGFSPDKIFIAPYTTNITPLMKIKISSFLKKRFLYVGSLIPRKGLIQFINILIDWMNNNQNEDIDFLYCGNGPILQEIIKLNTPKNLSIRWLGEVAYSDISNIFAKGNVFVFPTLADEWGLVVNEAMASGLPVMGSLYSQAVEDLVDENENGWRFHPDNYQEVYNSISKVMSMTPEGLQLFGKRARERISGLDILHVSKLMMESVEYVCDDEKNKD